MFPHKVLKIFKEGSAGCCRQQFYQLVTGGLAGVKQGYYTRKHYYNLAVAGFLRKYFSSVSMGCQPSKSFAFVVRSALQ